MLGSGKWTEEQVENIGSGHGLRVGRIWSSEDVDYGMISTSRIFAAVLTTGRSVLAASRCWHEHVVIAQRHEIVGL